MRKIISSRTEKLFMRTFISHYHQTSRTYFALSLGDFDHLRKRDDYVQVLHSLEARGLIVVYNADDMPCDVQLTSEAILYYENRRAVASDHLWQKWTTIISIIIALLTLLFEVFLNWPIPWRG